MKTLHDGQIRFALLTAMTLALCLSQPTAFAQPVEESPNLNPGAQSVSVELVDTTVAQYVQLLRDQTVDLNVIVDEAAAQVQIPSISLSAVPVESAIEILERIGDSRLHVEWNGAIALVRSEPQRTRPEQPVDITVLSVHYLLAIVPPEDLLSAIEIGMNLLPADTPAIQLKLHHETGLLFARGTHQQLSIVTETIEQLGVTADSKAMHEHNEANRK